VLRPHQQQDDLLVVTLLPSPGRTVAPPALEAIGWLAILFLISAAMVMNACSTFEEFLALVSRNGIPISSANACSQQQCEQEHGLVTAASAVQ